MEFNKFNFSALHLWNSNSDIPFDFLQLLEAVQSTPNEQRKIYLFFDTHYLLCDSVLMLLPQTM